MEKSLVMTALRDKQVPTLAATNFISMTLLERSVWDCKSVCLCERANKKHPHTMGGVIKCILQKVEREII